VGDPQAGLTGEPVSLADDMDVTSDFNRRSDSGDPDSVPGKSWKRLVRVFTEPERRAGTERRRGRDPLRCEDWSEGNRQRVRRASDRS
jgi:hypothetical protein